MATLRTEDEKLAILARCCALEKSGGDILAYLRSQHYVTPRATWINFQKMYLGRKPEKCTDGRPRRRDEVKKDQFKGKNAADRQKRLDGLVERLNKGMTTRQAMQDMGFTGGSCGRPGCVYRYIREYALKTNPEIAKMLPTHLGDDALVTIEDGKVTEAAIKGSPAEVFPKIQVEEPKPEPALKTIALGGKFGKYEVNERSNYFAVDVDRVIAIDDVPEFIEELRTAVRRLGIDIERR